MIVGSNIGGALASARGSLHPVAPTPVGRSLMDAVRADVALAKGAANPGPPDLHVGDVPWARFGNENGPMDVRTFTWAGRTVQALEKVGAEAQLEAFGGRLVRMLRLDHLSPAIRLDARGVARIEYRAGTPLREHPHIESMRDLEQHVAHGYIARDESLSEAAALRAARFDTQVMRAVDYVLANSDRNGGNVLVHADGTASWIDWGWIGHGEGVDPLRPHVYKLAEPVGEVEELHPAVVSYLRAHLQPPALRDLAERMLPTGLHERARKIDGMVARLQHVLAPDGGTIRSA